jgi:hypothetical protein
MPGQLPFRLPAWIPWLFAAMLAVVCAWFCLRDLETRAEIARLRSEQTLSSFEARMTRNQLLAERLIANRQLADQQTVLTQQARQIDALSGELKAGAGLARNQIVTFVPAAGNSTETQAVAVWNPTTGHGLLQVSRLPAPAAERDYQLWVIDSSDPVPVEGGVFSVDPETGAARVEFRLGRPAGAAARFALSLERKGGAPKPEGPIMLVSR